MTSRLSTISAILLGLILVVTSIASAALMAPDRSEPLRAFYALHFGDASADFCADHAGHDSHEHRCPFCHATPKAPEPTPPGRSLDFSPHDMWRQGESLRRAAQARNINHSTRAPPRIG